MNKSWRVTHQAEQSLIDIALWTVETFGPRQADAYEQDIITKLDDIASGVAHTQICSVLIDSELTDDIQFTRVGRHYLIFTAQSDSFVLLDLFHQSVDLPRHLARVAPLQSS